MRFRVDFEVSHHAKKAIRWFLLPLLTIVALGGIANAMLDPAPSTWIRAGSPVSSSALTLTLEHIDERLTNLQGGRAVMTIGTKKFSVGATKYCNATPPTKGDLSGLTAAGTGLVKAKNACEAYCGSSATSPAESAHVCGFEELARSTAAGVTLIKGRYLGDGFVYYNGSQGYEVSGCNGFTTAPESLPAPPIIKGSLVYGPDGSATWDNCDHVLPLLCCD